MEAFKFAKANKIKYIVNTPFSYRVIQVLFNFPAFSRTFGIGGFTVTYPHPLNPFLLMGFPKIYDVIRNDSLLLINTAIGLDQPNVFPTNHIVTGLLYNPTAKKVEIESDLKTWM